MKILEDIKEMLEDELKDIKKKGTRTPAEYEFMKTAVETIGKIEEICDKHCDEENERGYSGRMMPHYSGRNMMPMEWPDYDRGYSGNRMGTYDTGYSGRRMGRYYGHAEPSEKIVRELREMLDRPMSEREREVIMNTIDELSR